MPRLSARTRSSTPSPVTLQAYALALKQGDTLVIPSNSDFFRYLTRTQVSPEVAVVEPTTPVASAERTTP